MNTEDIGNVDHSSQDERRTEFLSIVQSLFPSIPELNDLEISGSLEDFWFKICRIVHLRPEKLAQKVAAHLHIEYLKEVTTEDAALRLVPRSLVEQEDVLPLQFNDNELLIAVCTPVDENLQRKLRFAVNCTLKFALTTPVDLIYARQYAYTRMQKGDTPAGTLTLEDVSPAEEPALLKLAKQLLKYCLEHNASDLHIHAFLGGGVVRARVDGLLRRIALLPEKVYVSICRYFKVNSGMDPTNDRIPQDGRTTLQYQGRDIELRLSALPVKGGERLVIRFLDQNRNFSLDENGFAVKEIQVLRKLGHSASGLFLITGPTGSGKTSTLYALLSELNSVQRNILTVENPVEYQLPGISQVDINEKAGLSFATALRSALRQDPDILLVGEIRDHETAEIALQGALTGHLVFSTLHTNDALTAIPRLLDLGINRSILADALVGISAQRLCRQLCKNCRAPIQGELFSEEEAFAKITKISPPFRPIGCDQCGHSGYRGRLPILEIVEADDTLRENILRGDVMTAAPSGETDPNALTSMALSAAKHIISGETTATEALRVLGNGFWHKLMMEYQVTLFDLPTGGEDADQKDAPGVIFIGREQPITGPLSKAFGQNHFDFHHVTSAQEAELLLRKNSNIVFVIVDLDDELSDKQLCAFVRDARQKLAWSRLLALLLVPEGRNQLPNLLEDEGATSPCMFKPLKPQAVVSEVKTALTYLNSREVHHHI